MLEQIIFFSIRNKLIVVLFTLTVVAFGLFSIINIPVGSVPDITNNQVQVITTSANLSTQEIEQFITAPVEMELANLPGVQEIRSISKFGISLVTVVFEESMGSYLPRQLIAEKLKSASEAIPEEYGKPEMGPITTGLGEIYQYTLEVKPGYEDLYGPMELRTIQDWIVKRRLSGIKGIVEVNSWGGYLKQYEVAVDPLLLKSMHISLMDIYNALARNNNVSGGAYIEKNMQSYFIRGDGLVENIKDIENIFIKKKGDIPLYIKDVANVHFGYANRFGAITANGKGETILGQVIMLKDANSKVVIKAVKNRIEFIQKNLPEGVFIHPVLERGELIKKTTFTITENLILGAIIVFFTVLLLLGNVRSALVIASMIPLALFFTITMMYLFGLDANLMSLGALDFGIIIDGAVIIVEYIVLKMSQIEDGTEGEENEMNESLRDKMAGQGTLKMMKSAIFGQIIILIVFIPILSLHGVEGKMFHPMALAFSFAILGAMIMGLTWLPVASSLFLRPVKNEKNNISSVLIKRLHKMYNPSILFACAHKRIILIAAFLSLIVTGILFIKIGAEFVPTLDEGDFVIQPVLKTGTSLSETVATTTRMEKIIKEGFPNEVDQIVSRIGAAEVPTDPMSMEEIDMIIKLKQKKEWVKAKTKDELAVLLKEALEVIPSVEYEFTQPIEMRFNELITGVRADIAIKLFGEDLDYINSKALEIKSVVEKVPGADDVILEKTTGLPQIRIEYNRQKLAIYQMDVKSLNNYLAVAFGGETTGVVFEGEKRFDMVLRLQKSSRTDINDIRSLMVETPKKGLVPLSEFADIQYSTGPAKISRDNTHRRVVVSVNVRNRDLQSVVDDIRKTIDSHIKFKPGNYIEYGGQFENLHNATRRLMVAVPVALLLIFIFLHFAFQSLKDAILIFTAIPLATVGGVLLLWLRGMPFSISAGVGFIALFGIAVLNGIVLIEQFKELQHQGVTNIRELIMIGTRNRLRPVLLTAGAAAMGFFPMAISHGAGAEVQRPLATVVIGGLVTSTLLTLIVLPILFEIFHNVKRIKLFPFRIIRSKTTIVLLLLLFSGIKGKAQDSELGLQELTQLALENNSKIKALMLQTEAAKADSKTAWTIPKTYISYSKDENNIAENGHPLNVVGIQQEFAFPTVYSSENKVRKLRYSLIMDEYELEKQQFLKDLSVKFYECQMLSAKITIYQGLDSIYKNLVKQFEKQLELKAISKLEYLRIKSKENEVSLLQTQLNNQYNIAFSALKSLVNSTDDFVISKESKPVYDLYDTQDSLLVFTYLLAQEVYLSSKIKAEKNKLLPDFTFSYFVGSNTYEGAQNYQGFEIGIAVPLFFGSQRNTIKTANFTYEAQQHFNKYRLENIKQRIQALEADYNVNKMKIKQYEEIDLPLAKEIKRTAIKTYERRDIDFLNFTSSLEGALKIESNYAETVFLLNKSYLELKYFTKVLK